MKRGEKWVLSLSPEEQRKLKRIKKCPLQQKWQEQKKYNPVERWNFRAGEARLSETRLQLGSSFHTDTSSETPEVKCSVCVCVCLWMLQESPV